MAFFTGPNVAHKLVTLPLHKQTEPQGPPASQCHLLQGHCYEAGVPTTHLGGLSDFLSEQKAYAGLCFGKLTVNPSIL